MLKIAKNSSKVPLNFVVRANHQLLYYNMSKDIPIDRWNFDGLDLDWEYPTQRGGIPEDYTNFAIWVKVSFGYQNSIIRLENMRQ